MNAKKTKVKLYALSLNTTQEYEIAHAERLLRLKDSGWQLPTDSEFQFTNENGITYKRRNKTKDTGKS